jgi:hypothetical protein
LPLQELPQLSVHLLIIALPEDAHRKPEDESEQANEAEGDEYAHVSVLHSLALTFDNPIVELSVYLRTQELSARRGLVCAEPLTPEVRELGAWCRSRESGRSGALAGVYLPAGVPKLRCAIRAQEPLDLDKLLTIGGDNSLHHLAEGHALEQRMSITAPVLALPYRGAVRGECVDWPACGWALCLSPQQLACLCTPLLQILHTTGATDHMACVVQLELSAVALVTHVYAPVNH